MVSIKMKVTLADAFDNVSTNGFLWLFYCFFFLISFCLCVRMLFFLFIERATLNKTLFLFLRCICQLKRWAPILNSSDDMPSTASDFVVNNASYFITIWLICSTNDKDRFAYGEINSPYSRYFFNVNFFCDSGNF